MSRSLITFIYKDEMFEFSKQRTSVNTVLDAFSSICGFYADDILLEKENTKKVHANDDIYFPRSQDNENNHYIISIPAILKAENIINLNNNLDSEYECPLDEILQVLFKEVIKKIPQLERVINIFLDNKLWEIAILSQICSSNVDARTELANKCSAAVSNINITENDKKDTHYIYTILYLKYLSISLLNDNNSHYNKYKYKNNQKLINLYNEIAQYYQKTNRPIFIKLGAMISSEMGNIAYSEKAGNQYIGLLLKEGNTTREIGRTFYNLGVLYEKFSNRGTYNLTTIYTALKYYNMAHERNKEDFMAWYKMAWPPYENASNIIAELMRLQDALDKIIEDGRDTFQMHLYRFKIISHVLSHNLSTWSIYKNAHKYLDELEKGYTQIESIWKYLYTHNNDELWLNELKQYIDIRVLEAANSYLAFCERDSIPKNYIKKSKNPK